MSDLPAPQTPREIIERYEPEEQLRSVLRSVSRSGSWEPPKSLSATAILGDVTLDFRDAELLFGETRVLCRAILGNVDVIVPDDIDVEVEGSVFMGEIKAEHRSARFDDEDGDEERPLLTIECSGTMGFITIRSE